MLEGNISYRDMASCERRPDQRGWVVDVFSTLCEVARCSGVILTLSDGKIVFAQRGNAITSCCVNEQRTRVEPNGKFYGF